MLQMTPNLVSTFRDIKSRNACKGFLIFSFFGILWVFSCEIFGKNLKIAKNFTQKYPENAKKSKYQKSLACVPRFYVSEGADQIWGHLKHLVAQILKKMQKFVSKFCQLSHTNRGNFSAFHFRFFVDIRLKNAFFWPVG